MAKHLLAAKEMHGQVYTVQPVTGFSTQAYKWVEEEDEDDDS